MSEVFSMIGDLINLIWMMVITVAVYKLWDRLDRTEPKQEQADNIWEPVDLSDEREYELERQELNRNKWTS